MDERRPWIQWPTIASTARANGWNVLAERRGVARIQRRDPRSPNGAATLHIEFDHDGLIAVAEITELGRRIGAQPDKLNTILNWLREPAPADQA